MSDQGCHSDQGKIPCAFKIFPVIFQPQNITFILLPLLIERYTTINIHSKPQSQMQRSLLQKLHSIIWLFPNSKFASKAKTVSHHNPRTSLNLKTRNFPCTGVNSLFKNIFVIFLANLLFFLSGKLNVQFRFPGPWPPRRICSLYPRQSCRSLTWFGFWKFVWSWCWCRCFDFTPGTRCHIFLFARFIVIFV